MSELTTGPKIELITMSDGSQRYVASPPGQHLGLILEWQTKLHGENPKHYSDLLDLHRFSFGGDPMSMNWATRRGLRHLFSRAQSHAIKNGQLYITSRDENGGVTGFKLCTVSDPEEKFRAMVESNNDRLRNIAYAERIENKCIVLEVDEDQIAAAAQSDKERIRRERSMMDDLFGDFK